MSTPERRWTSGKAAFADLFPEPPRSTEWIEARRERRERRSIPSLPSVEEFAERVSSRVMAKFDERHGVSPDERARIEQARQAVNEAFEGSQENI